MMLFHSVMNSDDERISRKIIEQQQKEKLKNTMYERVKDIGKEPPSSPEPILEKIAPALHDFAGNFYLI